MKRLLFILSIVVLGGGVYGQCPPGGNLAINTQQDIINFQNNYPNCTDLPGNLEISIFSVTDLVGLEQLTSVGSNLAIGFTAALTSLSGLDNPTSVGGGLYIDNNDALTSISGLDNLTSVGGPIGIHFNDALTTCNQLYHLLDGVDDAALGPDVGGTVPDVGGPIGIEINASPGECNSLQDILDAGPPAPPTQAIPTMSQWSFFLLVLIVFTVGLVGVYNVKRGSLES